MKQIGKNKKNEEKIDYKQNLKIYLSFLKKYKLIVAALILTVILDESLLLIDKFIFKYIIDKGTEFSSNIISAQIFLNILILMLCVYIGAVILVRLINWIQMHLMGKLETDIQYDIKSNHFNHIISLDHNFHTTNKTGALISRLGRGAGASGRFDETLIWSVFPFLVQIIIVSSAFFYFNWINSVVLLGICFVYILVAIFISRGQKKYLKDLNNAMDSETAVMADMLINVESIKHFGKDAKVKTIFNRFISKTKLKAKAHYYYWKNFNVIQNLIIAIGTILMVYFPLKQFIAGEISLGTVVFIYTTFVSIISPLRNFSHSIRQLTRALTDMNDLFAYGKVEKEVKDKVGAKNLKIKEGKIEFNNVKFGYKKRNIFNKFNLKIGKGKKVALVGHSGCGKSTLVKLLYRLYNLDKGEILIDGKDIKEFKQESLRSEMSIVPQEAILFDDTIYNNIAFSKPGATRKEIMAAIKFAQLDKIIAAFPKKESTIVGERGIKLSGGEKQRVSIARAILADKKILVLDEATSALDSETEYEIQKDLEKLMQGRTSIIIAHRLSTIMHADKIVVMDKGKIIQMGTHRDLITEGGEYQKLWNLQKGGYIK